MKLRVLGCAGSESPGRKSPAFLVDDLLLLDAGIIGGVLTQNAQEKITDVLLSHAHHDHVRGLPSFADNLIISGKKEPVAIIGSEATLTAVHEHLMNGLIWPDFSLLPTPTEPILRWQPIAPYLDFKVREYLITAFPVNHSIPTLAYRVQRDNVSLLYTGDMGPTPELWSAIGVPTTVIIEISFPNRLEELARKTGHLTAALLAKELALLPTLPPQILVTHIKPLYEKQIHREIEELGISGLSILRDGQEFFLKGGS
jgi:ribonuclease BN (tRNA processing enzyme)